MQTWHWLAIYSVCIWMGSFLGGVLPTLVTLTHLRMQLMMSLVAGFMLGVAILHLLTHAIVQAGPERLDVVAWSVLLGILTMFLMVRVFHFHQHGPVALDDEPGHDHDHDHGHDHGHDHDHGPVPAHGQKKASSSPLGWVGVFLGLSLHTAIDGAALAASVSADAAHGHGGFLGLAVFLAILLHKPLDALSITSIMQASGWSARARQLVNGSFALMCPLGALVFSLGLPQIAGVAENLFLGAALGFASGVFLCIALGDLLPELHFHGHDRGQLSVALLLGTGLAVAVGYLEPHGTHHLHGPNSPGGPVPTSSSAP